MKSMNAFAPAGLSAPFEHAGVLHLPEAGVEQALVVGADFPFGIVNGGEEA